MLHKPAIAGRLADRLLDRFTASPEPERPLRTSALNCRKGNQGLNGRRLSGPLFVAADHWQIVGHTGRSPHQFLRRQYCKMEPFEHVTIYPT